MSKFILGISLCICSIWLRSMWYWQERI